ncbi:MAG TPA: PCRF domain-containing protein [Candidatus Paceibacterota bacterium]|nr:PCRF domain-containing protein [Candidatus Paceibacterota bacterium]HQI26095.1 PCRF domain-containing protein [Candidatus Paceibacterota bacterium]HQJ83835.1 PCRF domain-containing protein [Candidatus Paceibacterota bacterium]
MQDKQKIEEQIAALEAEMADPSFWQNKDLAQEKVQEFNRLKQELAGVGKYDKGDAVVTIFAGAGGDDAEDWAAMLLAMYQKYAERQKLEFYLIHDNQNDHGGYRNVTFELQGSNAYGKLKNESGVHRLVRLSPFNAKSLRHTSFALVEVIPRFAKTKEIEIPDEELKVEFTRASGPGGQNVNKRETAVRIVHLPTNLSAHAESERSQAQNRDKAMAILSAKLYKKMEDDRLKKEKGMYVSKTTEIEWGNQIRSYVLHPYKLVKDHRTEFETSNVEAVLDGEIDGFLEAEKNLFS